MATVAKVQLPDGSIAELEIPDGTTPDQIKQFVQQTLVDKAPRPKVDPNSTLDPKDARAQAPLRLGQYAARAPGVPAWVTQAVDQYYGRNAGELRQQEADATSGLTQRFLRGLVQDPIVGTAQLAANATPAGPAVNEAVRADERRYQQNRAIGGSNGVDIARGAGTASAFVAPGRALPQAATWIGRAAQAGGVGAVAGATMPVTEGGDYWGEKGKQVATTAVVSAALAPPLEIVVRGAAGILNAAGRAVGAVRARMARPTDADIDSAVQAALDQHSPGIRLSDIAPEIQANLREQVRAAGNVAGLNPQQTARVADMAAVGVTPTRGKATLDPVLVSREKNLAKMGANSDDPALQTLARTEQGDNQALIARANTLAGGTADDFSAGALALRALRGVDQRRADTVTRLYNEARQLNGGEIPLDGVRFVDQASRALDAEMRGGFLPAEIRTILQRVANGEIPFNISTQEQLRTMLATATRGAQDGNVRAAVGAVRNALEDAAPVLGNTPQTQAVQAAFARARNAHRARMAAQEGSPSLQAAVDGIEPDRFVQQFIVGRGASVADVQSMRTALAGDPEAFGGVRTAIVNHLKGRALSQAADEVGTFSQSAYNRALNDIGDRKLAAFFSPQEIAQLRQLGRAAAYSQVQPRGAAVNNSNSGALVAAQANNLFSRIANNPVTNALLGAIPGGGMVRDAAHGVARRAAEQRAREAAAAEANSLLAPLGLAPTPQVVDANRLVRILGPAATGAAVAKPAADR